MYLCLQPTQVQQSAMLVPMAQMPAQLIHILAAHRASDPSHKVRFSSCMAACSAIILHDLGWQLSMNLHSLGWIIAAVDVVKANQHAESNTALTCQDDLLL